MFFVGVVRISGTIIASAVITDRMMELWGITKEQLHQDAVAVEMARSPVCFYSMEDMMDEIIFSSKPENLFERTEPLDATTMIQVAHDDR